MENRTLHCSFVRIHNTLSIRIAVSVEDPGERSAEFRKDVKGYNCQRGKKRYRHFPESCETDGKDISSFPLQ